MFVVINAKNKNLKDKCEEDHPAYITFCATTYNDTDTSVQMLYIE